MAMNIDWHSHHTAPEISDRIKELTGKRPHIDALDSPDFSKRIKEMDEAGLDLQLICQGAGVYADQLPPDQALDIVRMSNNVLAERLAGHKDRLLGVTRFVAQKYRRVRGGNRTHGKTRFSRRAALSARRRQDAGRHARNGPDLRENFRARPADFSAWRRHGARSIAWRASKTAAPASPMRFCRTAKSRSAACA